MNPNIIKLGIHDRLRVIASRIAAPFQRHKLDRDLDAELASHLAMAIEEKMCGGMSRSEARIVALRSFGGITQTREAYRAGRGLPWIDQVARDLRYGWRQLVRAPGFALTAILTLALGLGANTAIFSLINALLLRPLPVPHSDELAILHIDESDSDFPNYNFNSPLFRAIEKRQNAFVNTAAFSNTEMQIHGASGNQEVSGQLVSGQYFAELQIPPLFGRYLTPADDQPGSAGGYVAVISEGFWRTWFNGSSQVLGAKLTIANNPFTVVGVMPGSFFGADPTTHPSVFAPLSAQPIVSAPFDFIAMGWHANWLNVIARRKPGVSLAQANAALHAATNSIFRDAQPDAGRLRDLQTNHAQLTAESGSKGFTYLRTQFREPLTVVFALCGGVLLLACLNLAGLLLARAAARERELATRLAIGASRLRLIRQLLTESLLIATLGTVAGLAVSPLASRLLAHLLLSGEPDTVLDTSLDIRVFLFAALVTVASSVLIGLLPALRATSGDLNDKIKSGSQTHVRRESRQLLPRLVMASQVALALMLVTGAALLATSLTRLYRTDLGFNPKGLVHLRLDMDKQPLAGDALTNWYRQFAEALSHRPGVQAVSFESDTPLSGSSRTTSYGNKPDGEEHGLYLNNVAPGYFTVMKTSLIAGRDFNWSDTASSGSKVILNQAAADLLFPGHNSVGHFIYSREVSNAEVVGVVGNVHYMSIREQAPPTVYVPLAQTLYLRNGDGTLKPQKSSYVAVVRISGPPSTLASETRSLISRMAPDIPAPPMVSMTSLIDQSITSERVMALLAAFFGFCALLVTAIGLYGTLAYATSRRTSEIGIRMALGSRRLQVVILVFRQNAWVAISGCLAGLAAALMASRALASILYNTSTHDPVVLLVSVASLLAIATAASLIPAVRAARIEPMEALRAE